jgi:BirA family transcriptional regulator, biotin operon repressor / biotin---[acetyl-CoA-carboxylase] ligase
MPLAGIRYSRAMLDLAAISQALGGLSCRFDVDLLPACDSTNARLLARAETGSPSGTVVVATTQTAGRGRRGRTWISAPGDSLTFSLLWRFAPGTAPGGLSLAVGLAVAQAIEKFGASKTALKWPNDLLLGGKKLAGILIELQPGAPHVAVIGIGLNLRLPETLPPEVRAEAAALGVLVDANLLLAALLGELLAVLETFAIAGFPAMQNAWMAQHAFQDAPVSLLSDFAPPRAGICRGVDADGALLFEENGRVERVLSGEISLRKAA